MSENKTIYSSVAIFVSLVIVFVCIHQIRWKNEEWKNIIVSDGYGYYAYLPAIFIYHDLQYNAVYEHERQISGNTAGYYLRTVNDRNVNKYFAGVAVVLSPFFLIANALAKILHEQSDGFSKIYQEAVSVGALFYLSLGLWFLRKLLREYKINDYWIATTLLLFVFATNLFHYVVSEPSMSHVYSFAMIAGFLHFAKKSFVDFNAKNILGTFVLLAIVCLIRPPNILILTIVPFLAGGRKQLKEFLVKLSTSSRKLLFIALAIFIIIVSIQPILYWLQTGNLFVYSYQNEYFDFTKPKFSSLLFSYRKGLFIYTPILFISMFSLIYLWINNKYLFFSLLFFLFTMIYIVSSWYMWYYGASFGMRAIIDFYAVFSLMFAIILNELNNSWLKYPVIIFSIFFLGINQVQAYQYRHYIMEHDKMSKFKYWKIFLKTDDEYMGLFWKKAFYEDIRGTTLRDDKINFDDKMPGWESLGGIEAISPDDKNKSQRLDSNNIYGATLEFKKENYLYRNVHLALKIKLKTYFESSLTKASIIVSIDSSSKTYFYKTECINDLIPIKEKQWQQSVAAIKLPFIENKEAIIKVYVLFEKGPPFYIDDFEVELVDATIW